MVRAARVIVGLVVAVFGLQFAGAAGRVTMNLAGDPKTLDPHLATGVLESAVINQMMEGLTLLDSKGVAVPGMAESWKVSESGTSYTFFLRDAKWSNGEPVRAQDFVYGWRRCLAPATAAEYAYQLFVVKGAQEYNSGKVTDAATVGVAAESDRVLTVQLVNPTPYFLSVASHYAFFPLNEAWVSAHGDWSASPGSYLVNGPFSLAEWKHRDRIILKKNPQWYGAAGLKLDEIVFTMISNESTALMQWETDKLDVVTEIPLPDVPRLKQAGVLQVMPYLGTYYLAVNGTAKPFNDARVRKAFSLAIDRGQIVKAILRGGQKEAYGIVPYGMEIPGVGDFRETTGDAFKQDIAKAKQLLAEAGYPNGRGLPPVKFLYNDLEMHRTIGEALQRMWAQNLGVRVGLQVQEYKVYLQSLHGKAYQVARAGWIADFSDPLALLDMFQTGAGNNNFGYSSPEFDKLLSDARGTTDTVRRTELLRSAERKLIAEDMAVMPLYFYVKQVLVKSRVKGLIFNPMGNVDFRGVSVE